MKFPLNMVDYNNLIGDASGHILFKSELAEVVRMANAYDEMTAMLHKLQNGIYTFHTDPLGAALNEVCAKYPVRGAS